MGNKDLIDRLLVIASGLHENNFDEFGDDIADIANRLQEREPKPGATCPPTVKPTTGLAAMVAIAARDASIHGIGVLRSGTDGDDIVDALRYLGADFGRAQKPMTATQRAIQPKEPIPVFFYARHVNRDLPECPTELRIYERVGSRMSIIKTVRSAGPEHDSIPCDVKLIQNKHDRGAQLTIIADGSTQHIINDIDGELAIEIYENQKRLAMAKQLHGRG